MTTDPLYHYQATFVGGYDEAEARRAVLWCTDGSDDVSKRLQEDIKNTVEWLVDVLDALSSLGSAGTIVEGSDGARKRIHVILFRMP